MVFSKMKKLEFLNGLQIVRHASCSICGV